MVSITQFFQRYPRIFITGTDTEVGKTYVSSLMVSAALKESKDVFPFKPISAGTDDNGINEDAAELYKACAGRYEIEEINPIVYQHPIAPHIAAEQEEDRLDMLRLDSLAQKALKDKSAALVEGAGGWFLPLNENELLSDWVKQQNWPVVMVVGVKLGCLNHALLTAHAIQEAGIPLVGWVANFIQGENEVGRKNVEYLQQKLPAPLLFEVQKHQTELV